MTMDTFLRCDYKTKQTFVNCADIAILGQSGKSTSKPTLKSSLKSSLKPVNKTTVAPIPSRITTSITTKSTTKTNPVNDVLPLYSQCGGIV